MSGGAGHAAPGMNDIRRPAFAPIQWAECRTASLFLQLPDTAEDASGQRTKRQQKASAAGKKYYLCNNFIFLRL